MGKKAKIQPSRLASKLVEVRSRLELTQEEMVKLVVPGVRNTRLQRTEISHYEIGRRAPTLIEVLNYAKAVRDITEYKDFNVEDLIDDERDLPWLLETS